MRRSLLYTVLLAMSVLFTGCPKEDNPVTPEEKGTISTGESTDIVVLPVGIAGGTFKVSRPGNALDGMTIGIPSGAFSQYQDLRITSAPITGHKLGSNFNPISPMITVHSTGGYANDLITLTIPIALPKGHFAMGFLYNEKTGRIEGLPILALSDSSITVVTRHFATSSVSGPSSSTQRGGGTIQDLTGVGNIVISSIDEATLLGRSTIETGFKSGTDDWEFTNYGSFLSPGGHCAGQSITSMYYYYEKKKSEGALYHRYDKVQSSQDVLWQDNRRGFRFASVIQEDLQWDGWLFTKLLTVETTPQYHHLSWKAFALSMLLTGEPQFVGLSRGDAGHAIVAYRMDLTAGNLYVADPNFPGQERTIEYVNKQFKPYNTKQNASEADVKAYTGVGYYAKTSMIDWDKIAARWEEFHNGSIGTKGANQFPSYQLWVEDGAGYELGDTLTTDLDTLALRPRWSGAADAIAFQVFDPSGKRLLPEASQSYTLELKGTVKLQPGWNTFGIGVFGKTSGGTWGWIDFRWVTVRLTGYSIEPTSSDGAPIAKNGEINQSYGFRVNSNGMAPKNARYVWNFGDGQPEVTKNNDSTVTHTYQANGEFALYVQVYDNATGKLAGEAVVYAKIVAGDTWGILHALKRIVVQFQAERTYSNGATTTDNWEIDNIGSSPPPFQWNGKSLLSDYTLASPVGDLGSDTVQVHIQGTLSDDGMTITTMTAYKRHIEYVYSLANKLLWIDEEITGFTITNFKGAVGLPGYPPYFFQTGADIQPLITGVQHIHRRTDFSPEFPDGKVTESHYISTNWNSSLNTLVVGFQQ